MSNNRVPGAATMSPIAGRTTGKPGRKAARRTPWWIGTLTVAVVATAVSLFAVTNHIANPAIFSGSWWILTIVFHLPFVVIALFLLGGFIERIGYFWRGRRTRTHAPLPAELPTVCIQLPMFNEDAVAHRAIYAAGQLDWPAEKLEIQVLDDSTDAAARQVVDDACAVVRTSGIRCHVIHRTDRAGYKAGALENGRKLTAAKFIAIFDADFVVPADYLQRTIGHFWRPDGQPDHELALVQAQWGHLNAGELALTRAQTLWVDDHHSVQMSWRSEQWKFVNFTGTAGVWRAQAIESVGGWRAASLVEDCELSFRHLFGGYRTTFVPDVVAPAELPATYTAYKAQQKRWTQGWVQLERLHLKTLLSQYRTPLIRKLHLTYHMMIPWQWPAWMCWLLILPPLIYSGLWFGGLGTIGAVAVYLVPTKLFLIMMAVIASIETRHSYPTRRFRDVLGRTFRVVPYAIISTGMLPHQFSAFIEGLLGPLHSEFERTPKTASISVSDASGASASQAAAKRRQAVKIHWPYVGFELFFLAYQAGWALLFAFSGLWWPAIGATGLALCVAYLMFWYGDNIGRVLFVVNTSGRTRRRETATEAQQQPSIPTAEPEHSTVPVSAERRHDM